MIQNSVFTWSKNRFFIIFLSTIRKLYYGILMQRCGERIFSNQQLGMRFYIRIAIIMVLQQQKLARYKLLLSREQNSNDETSLNTPGFLLIGRLTARLITY